ncbi:hypothetical protein [Vibrio harveyi]|uniref:hypothetical protein n=1 Tax=Vibrio harveyi group TaxID=717610 RepID=UPI00237FE592|nr:hypothetical protein [Vibrio harveyi]
MDKSIIGQHIGQRMRELGIKTNKELSDKSGVSRAIITNVQLNPNKKLMAETALYLAKGLECRPEWLILNDGPVNLDEIERANRLKYGAPVVTINELADLKPDELIESLMLDEGRQRHPCPAGNSHSTFIVKSSEGIVNYPAGLFYFDYKSQPTSGQLVIATVDKDATPEIMSFYQTRGKRFLESLVKNLPGELKTIEVTDEMEILATMKCHAIV